MAVKTKGIISFKIDGIEHYISGDITYTDGSPKREEVITDAAIMFKEMRTSAMIEGKIQNHSDFSWKKFQALKGVNILLDLGIGKSLLFIDCFYSDEGKGSSESGELDFKFTASGGCEEITS